MQGRRRCGSHEEVLRTINASLRRLLDCIVHCVQQPSPPWPPKAASNAGFGSGVRLTADTDLDAEEEEESRVVATGLLGKPSAVRVCGKLRKQSPTFPYRWYVRYCEFLGSIRGSMSIGILVYWSTEAGRLRRGCVATAPECCASSCHAPGPAVAAHGPEMTWASMCVHPIRGGSTRG